MQILYIQIYGQVQKKKTSSCHFGVWIICALMIVVDAAVAVSAETCFDFFLTFLHYVNVSVTLSICRSIHIRDEQKI